MTLTNHNENDKEANEELILSWREKCRKLDIATTQGFVSLK
jgi:hypothetical protein